jgi:hypothetical protein
MRIFERNSYGTVNLPGRKSLCQCSRLQAPREQARLLKSKILRIKESLEQKPQVEKEIRQLLSSLQDCPYPPAQGDNEKLSSTWKLLWTTEKETLFILKNARFFGTNAGNVYQVIRWVV